MSKCVHCSRDLDLNAPGTLAPHVCPNCQFPQPVAAGEDYFQAFSVPRAFKQDRPALEKRFYQLSRALHPDRFSTGNADAKRYSLERMSFLNEAYSTLKSTEGLRDYLLKLEGIAPPPGKQAQIPMELTEAWFELQDLLMEDPERAKHKLAEFEKDLKDFALREATALQALEREYDEKRTRQTLDEVAKKVQSQSYLTSMERDVARLKGRLQA